MIDGEVRAIEWFDGEPRMVARWCAGCNHDHGYLWTCQSYSPAILAEISLQSQEFRTKAGLRNEYSLNDQQMLYGEMDPREVIDFRKSHRRR